MMMFLESCLLEHHCWFALPSSAITRNIKFTFPPHLLKSSYHRPCATVYILFHSLQTV